MYSSISVYTLAVAVLMLSHGADETVVLLSVDTLRPADPCRDVRRLSYRPFSILGRDIAAGARGRSVELIEECDSAVPDARPP